MVEAYFRPDTAPCRGAVSLVYSVLKKVANQPWPM